MTQNSPVQITREPVVNRNRAITANRLIVHAPSIPVAVEALGKLSDCWPDRYTVFLSLGRLVPTTDLMKWEFPENVMVASSGVVSPAESSSDPQPATSRPTTTSSATERTNGNRRMSNLRGMTTSDDARRPPPRTDSRACGIGVGAAYRPAGEARIGPG